MIEFLRDWWLSIALVVLAAIGGTIGSTMRQLEAGDGEIKWFIVGVETLASAFSGILVMMLCQSLNLSVQMTGVIVGVCGWFGGRTTMLWLEKRVRRVLEGDKP